MSADPLSVKVGFQITPRMRADLDALMKAENIDLSTAIRATIRVGLTHSSEVREMARRDEKDRDRRVSERSALGGRRGMATRRARAEAARSGFVDAVRDYAESVTPPAE